MEVASASYASFTGNRDDDRIETSSSRNRYASNPTNPHAGRHIKSRKSDTVIHNEFLPSGVFFLGAIFFFFLVTGSIDLERSMTSEFGW